MTQYSYSRVSLFEDCPYHFKLRYIDRLTELPNYEPRGPLILGKTMHEGIEHGVEHAIRYYENQFPVITDDIINEQIKFEILIPKVQQLLEEMFVGCELIHEYEIDEPGFKGYVDLIAKAPDGTCAVLDFKYTSNIKNYMDSAQLHLYRDKLIARGFDVRGLGYIYIPKKSIKRGDNEDLYHYRKRIVAEMKKVSVQLVPIQFDDMQTIYFLNTIEEIENAKLYPRNVSGKCFGCMPKFKPDYLELVTNGKGDVLMALPKNERRERQIDTKPDLWLYADSYVGKSTFVDQFPNVLFANTDGNTDNTTAPVISIKDEVTKVGRKTERKLAWEVFLDMIDDLETEDNDFEAVALDLVEDLREHCRIYVFEKNDWEHESDGGFGKGWDKVKIEWQKAIKRLKSLGYQIIYISKEIAVEITGKAGAKRTTYRPNIDEKTANFLTGTVDLTIRAFINSNDERFLQLAKKQGVFGGGRFDFKEDVIPLDYEEFIEALKDAQADVVKKSKSKRQKSSDDEADDDRKSNRRKTKETSDSDSDNVSRRNRRGARNTDSDSEEDLESNNVVDDEQQEENQEETARTRKRRGHNEKPADVEADEDDEPKTARRGRRSKSEGTAEGEKPRERKRRDRQSLDDTPPGEGDEDEGEPVEETSSRRRRSRR